MYDEFHFSRSYLASLVVDKISKRRAAFPGRSLFLTSPRYTGKSRFLQRDLVPELERNEFIVLYIDLWSPSQQGMVTRVITELARVWSRQKQMRPKAGFSADFGVVRFGTRSVTLPGGESKSALALTQVIHEISQFSGHDLVVILDEAQEILNDPAGLQLFTALRDALYGSGLAGNSGTCHLVCAGSFRDKLNTLVTHRTALFRGSEYQEFSRLGRDFIEDLVARINPKLSEGNQLDVEDVGNAFSLLGYQPGTLLECVSEYALGPEGSAGLGRLIARDPDRLRAKAWQRYQADLGPLTDLQRAVLSILIEDGASFSPFAAKTLGRMGDHLREAPSAPKVQKALDALREKGIVWRPGRGSYALEDKDMRDWLVKVVAQAS